MAWTESHQALLNHRKTGRLIRALGVSKVEAIGHLHIFWWWCLDNAPDGDLTNIDLEDIADGACWEGDPDKFINGMVHAGFIDSQSSGNAGPLLCVHDWLQYGGKLLERRQKDADRKKQGRYTETPADIPTPSERVPSDIHRTSIGHPADVSQTAYVDKTRQDDKTIEEITKHKTDDRQHRVHAREIPRNSPTPKAPLPVEKPDVENQHMVEGLSSSVSFFEKNQKPTTPNEQDAFINDTLSKYPHWVTPLLEKMAKRAPANPVAWQVGTLWHWLQGDGAPTTPSASRPTPQHAASPSRPAYSSHPLENLSAEEQDRIGREILEAGLRRDFPDLYPEGTEIVL